MYSGASCARALQRGNSALDFEGLAERMARAYRGHHSLAGRLPAIEGQGAASFGLSCAPRIMTAILGKVLSMDERVRRGTDHYIDDIVVRESVLSAQELREHLARYGLESKAPEGLDGGRVLGISLRKGSGGHLEMSRGMALSEIVMDQSRLTKRGLFSLCGRLVGHYPVARWLRPCCSFLKRLGCGGSWDEPVESSVGELANELLVRARAEDPVRGRWHVSPHGTVTVWTDASSLGMGVALEVDGSVAEDASWLRKESDHRHINVAELEAVARGINLAISWGFKTFTVATDSRTVISWMDNTVEGHRRVRTKGASEMLIKRRLGVIRDTITEFGLTVTVRFVSTTENKADRMTRVPKKWLGHRDTGEEGADVSAALATGESVEDAIWAAHLPHHLGVDRTLYLARQIRSNLTREQVKRELVGCEACQRIDPARREENLVAQGSFAVDGNWRRVAVDVTHYGAKHYLSMVDCGPSRFAIWRRLSSETAASIIAQLQGIVIERGPCDEFLLDNSTAFRSAAVEQFADEWGISLRFRAAYAPSGNGIVERNHRTIKRIAERGGISPEEATFWYNVTPRKDTDAGSVPSNGLYRYTWRVPFDVNLAKVESFEDSPFAVGDEVWVKPPIPSCTRQWSLGIVSDVVSRYVVRVDGMPRHVKDIRKRRYGSNRGVEVIPLHDRIDRVMRGNSTVTDVTFREVQRRYAILQAVCNLRSFPITLGNSYNRSYLLSLGLFKTIVGKGYAILGWASRKKVVSYHPVVRKIILGALSKIRIASGVLSTLSACACSTAAVFAALHVYTISGFKVCEKSANVPHHSEYEDYPNLCLCSKVPNM
ncbi:hypothetical protein GQR58_025339 [Nymphon striatum]|nr:hypothetical protein GQR58_025339 [Nymphon striatum]